MRINDQILFDYKDHSQKLRQTIRMFLKPESPYGFISKTPFSNFRSLYREHPYTQDPYSQV